jgi:DNA-directed RNA polymerase subunit N (RpoN/RPB10)
VPGLIRCFTIEADTGSVWLVYHPRLKGHPQARTLLDALTQAYGSALSDQ